MTALTQISNDAQRVCFSLCGEQWIVARADLEALWNSMDPDVWQEGEDERLPYWAELWPSSLALAQWVWTHQKNIRGKNCLDLGCGLGFTAIVGAKAGARVLGADYEQNAITMAEHNASLNHLATISANFSNAHAQRSELSEKNENCENCGTLAFTVMDWRKPKIPARSMDFIWAADIVYERAAAQPVLDFLDFALTDDGTAWIAEPSRTIFDSFHEAISQSNFCAEKVFLGTTEALSPQIPAAHVNIWEIKRKK